MQQLRLFLPCAAGVEAMLADEAARIAGAPVQARRAGVRLAASWRDAMRLNLHSRLCQRVLIELAHGDYRHEQDLYEVAANVAWEAWFTPRQSFKIELTAQHSPLQSLNFAALRIKDAIADRFRDKRGWREDKGDAPLKETLAAAMISASGWDAQTPLYDPCCGSGTIAIEAAQIACGIAPGLHRRFGFERLAPFQPHVWAALRQEAEAAQHAPTATVFGSDVAHRMVDFAQRNAQRAGVAAAVQLRGGDALQRMPPAEAGTMLLNPPYGERIAVAGVAGAGRGQPQRGRETAQTEDGGDFFPQLATHWKRNYAGWTAWVLTPDAKLPSRMRLKESRRVPMWNGPIECRLLRFELVAGSARNMPAAPATPAPPAPASDDAG
jgi:putative N6-adenine-specific DNA methylase